MVTEDKGSRFDIKTVNEIQCNGSNDKATSTTLKREKQIFYVGELQNLDVEDKYEPLSNGSVEKQEIDDANKCISTRFQIQRQDTSVLIKGSAESEEEDILAEVSSYEEKLEKVLVSLNVQATSLKTKDTDHTLVMFCLENNRVEDVILRLQENGIGNSRSDTSISVIPASVHFEVPLEKHPNHRYFRLTINMHKLYI